jgi:hypothetical protein
LIPGQSQGCFKIRSRLLLNQGTPAKILCPRITGQQWHDKLPPHRRIQCRMDRSQTLQGLHLIQLRIQSLANQTGEVLTVAAQLGLQPLVFPITHLNESCCEHRQCNQHRDRDQGPARPPDLTRTPEKYQQQGQHDQNTERVACPPIDPGEETVGKRYGAGRKEQGRASAWTDQTADRSNHSHEAYDTLRTVKRVPVPE